jgi:hypothetical protein
MQLIEYIFHRNPVCNESNAFATRAGIIINHLEPIALWLGILYFYKPLPSWINYLLTFYIVCSIVYTKSILETADQCTVVTKESYPHLHWKWNEGVYATKFYLLFLICVCVLCLYGLRNGRFTAALTLVSFAWSYFTYGTKHSVGAMWCFAAAFCPWLLSLLH